MTTINRNLPWYNLGTELDSFARTSKDAITRAGLDWTVEKRKMYTLNASGNKILVPDTFAITRNIDDKVLGTVKGRYTTFQNEEAFSFTDSIVQAGEAVYESAGELKGGKAVYLAMKLPETFTVGGEDLHEMYILLRTSHNGGGAIRVFLTPIRVKCTNIMSTVAKSAEQSWSITHVGSLSEKLAEAQHTLQNTQEYMKEFVLQSEELMRIKITDEKAYKILEDVLPQRPKTEEKIEAMMDYYKSSPTNGYTGTGWGLLNALTEYQEHGIEHRSPEAHFWTGIDGYVNSWRNAVVDHLLG